MRIIGYLVLYVLLTTCLKFLLMFYISNNIGESESGDGE